LNIESIGKANIFVSFFR